MNKQELDKYFDNCLKEWLSRLELGRDYVPEIYYLEAYITYKKLRKLEK